MKQFIYFVILQIITIVIICSFIHYNTSTKVYNNTYVDSVKQVNDSTCVVIRNSTIKVKELQTNYENQINIIDTQSVNADIELFTKYLSKDSL